MKKAALISVSDRTGLVELSRALSSSGYTLLVTSGTGKLLKESGIETLSIESYTAQKEILDGRVKTLHPKIHAGILARRDNEEHLWELASNNILPIELVIVNLYPFIENLKSEKINDPFRMVELVDIGGPTMLRAASKNFRFVLPLIDPADYPEVIAALQQGDFPLDLRRRLAVKVFTTMANYDLQVAKYFSNVQFNGDSATVDSSHGFEMGAVEGCVLVREQALRYGENPHQQGNFYRVFGGTPKDWEQLHGKELSYNNLLDFDAALKIISSFNNKNPTAVIIKHLNPCGAASASTLLEALVNSKRSDPRSHFGGILAFNSKVTADVAAEIREGFAEIVIAPEYDKAALELLIKSKNLRIIRSTLALTGSKFELRTVNGGALIQEVDAGVSSVDLASCASSRSATAEELRDLAFAWNITAFVKSNAVVIAKGGTLLGVGAGQMSRIDSTEVAISKARMHGHDLSGAVAASDAFFPFPDSIETLAKAGIRAIIVPSGSKRDEDSVAAANNLGIALLFTNDRHFRH